MQKPKANIRHLSCPECMSTDNVNLSQERQGILWCSCGRVFYIDNSRPALGWTFKELMNMKDELL